MVDPGFIAHDGRKFSVQNDLADIERLGLKPLWGRYQRRLSDLGIVMVIKNDDGLVEFRVDSASVFNGDSYKGYQYSLTPAEHPKTSLDNYNLSSNDKDENGNYLVSKSLKGHWSIYLFVNH